MDVRSWDFSKTWMYFQATTAGGVTEKFAEYAASLPKCKVFDFRGKAFDKRVLDKAVEENRFIVVDGTSLAGKTTFAKRVSEEYGINVVDIDEYCLKWLKELMCLPLAKDQILKKLATFPKDAMIRLTNELESIVLSKSEGGKKAVILVGVFIYDMQRFVVLDKIGRHFSGVTSILLYEPYGILKARFDKREERDFNSPGAEDSLAKIQKDHYVISVMLSNPISEGYLGIGATESYVLDSKSTKRLF